MAGKRVNGEGSISYDKQRKRYRVRVTVGWEYDEEKKRTKQVFKNLGSYKTKTEANRVLYEYIEMKQGNTIDMNITFEDFYNIWFDNFIEDHKSLEAVIKASYQYCGNIYKKKVRDITILDMKNCIYEGLKTIKQGKDKGTVKLATPTMQAGIKSMFNYMFAYAVEAGIVQRNYAKDFALKKEVFDSLKRDRKKKTPFSKEQLAMLYRSKDFVPFADMILYSCYSGWRLSEMTSLKVENVDLDNMVVVGGVKTIAGRNRTVPIHKEMLPIITKYYNEAKSLGSEYLFNDSSKPKYRLGLSNDRYLSRFHKVMKALNFDEGMDEPFTPHCARHTFITIAKSAHMDENVLKLIVGHAITDITESVYTHRSIDELKEEINKIEVCKK